MAEEKKSDKQQKDGHKANLKNEKGEEKKEKKDFRKEENYETLVRIMGFDIPSSRTIFAGLTRIKGVSWAIANALCIKLGYQKSKKIADLSKADIEKIENFLKELPVSDYLKNRRSDPETGETSHIFGSDLDMIRSFDIKRLKQIKSYKGIRHSMGLPVRGQKTRSHFRTKGRKAVGVTKRKEAAKK